VSRRVGARAPVPPLLETHSHPLGGMRAESAYSIGFDAGSAD
jgi:hypothetical protein